MELVTNADFVMNGVRIDVVRVPKLTQEVHH